MHWHACASGLRMRVREKKFQAVTALAFLAARIYVTINEITQKFHLGSEHRYMYAVIIRQN